MHLVHGKLLVALAGWRTRPRKGNSVSKIDAWLTARSRRTIKPLGITATIGMWIVLIMGATVTNTGSQTGCGPSWPLCRGQFIPQFAVSTFIEFSHRTVVGIESFIVIAFAIAAFALYRERLEIRILAPAMVAFLFLQAGLGAAAVMYPESAAILALHFGISLLSFASVALVLGLVYEIDRADERRDRPVPRGFVTFVWALTVFSYVVVYLGAYVRHAHADKACQGWPLCNGQVVPALQGLAGTNFLHRAAALCLTIGVAILYLWASKLRETRPDLTRAAGVALILVVLQAVSGAIVVATRVDLFSALAHAGLVALFFTDLCYVCLRLSPRAIPASQLLPTAHAAYVMHTELPTT